MIETRGKGTSLSTDCPYGRSFLALVLITLLTLSLFPAGADAATKRSAWKLKDKLRVHLLYELGYDNNYLELSDRDKERFLDGTLTFVTDVESHDALVQTTGIKFNLRTPRVFGWRSGGLTYTLKYQQYLNNSFNNRAVHNLYFSHNLVRRVDLFGSYLYIPDRYLRDYYDRDYKSVQASQFQYSIGGAGLRYSPKKLSGLSLSGRYESYTIYYNPRFTEYDTQGWGYRFDVRYRLTSHVTVTALFKKRFSDNVGFSGISSADSSQQTTDSEYGDGSNGEEWFEFIVNWETPKLLDRRWDVETFARFRHRYFTSELPLADDPIHRGREHMHSRLGVSITGPLVGNLHGGPMMDIEMRRTDSPLEWVGETKDFSTWRIGLALSYKVW